MESIERRNPDDAQNTLRNAEKKDTVSRTAEDEGGTSRSEDPQVDHGGDPVEVDAFMQQNDREK